MRLLQVCDEIRSDALLSVVLVLNGDDADVVIAQTVPHLVVQKHMKTYESIQKRAYQSIWLYHAASSSLLNAINVPKSVLLKCETAWEAFKQGTIRRLRNKERLT